MNKSSHTHTYLSLPLHLRSNGLYHSHIIGSLYPLQRVQILFDQEKCSKEKHVTHYDVVQRDCRLQHHYLPQVSRSLQEILH